MNIRRSKLFAESWNVAWRKKTDGGLLVDTETPFNVIRNSFRYWAADPFLFEHEGKAYIFAELYDYILRRGVIGFCELRDGRTTAWKPVIAEKYHLSFPNIYEEESSVYILPEASASNSLYRYRATEFPDKWTKDKIYRQNVKYADTVYISETQALTYDVSDRFNPELKILSIDEPDKDGFLDLPNMELRRPAGESICGKIRPAQNCDDDYGKGLIFYEYSLEGECYRERELKRIMPEDIKLSEKLFLDGIHTYNCNEHYEVIDIKSRRLNPINLLFRTLNKMK